jgi:hypothetical protein
MSMQTPAPSSPAWPAWSPGARPKTADATLKRLQASARRAKLNLQSTLFGFAACLAVTTAFAVGYEDCRHWFLVPVFCCGVLLASDAMEWLRGRLDVFDPVGVLALFGLHFFFIAPMLHVAWEYFMYEVQPPPDWRDWLGGMACLNFAGLLVYRITRSWMGGRAERPRKQRWVLDRQRFAFMILPALALSFAMLLYFLARMGGVSGMINAYENRMSGGATLFSGAGWIMALSEIFPILGLMALVIFLQRYSKPPSWVMLGALLVAFVAVQLFCGGLFGSRSNTMRAMVWGVGLVHFCVRPVPRRFVLVGLIFVVGFMYIYGFYKSAGMEGLRIAFSGAEQRKELETQTGRGFETLLLADLGRADVQAFLLYRIWDPLSDYRYALGRTYVAAMRLFIPSFVWPDRPPTKVKEGTEVIYGAGTYDPVRWSASRVYGLAGEAMLNFGPFSVPVAFGVLGLIIGKIRGWMSIWGRDEIWILILPALVSLSMELLSGDLDNIMFIVVKNGALPLIVMLLSARVVPVRATTQATTPAYQMAT